MTPTPAPVAAPAGPPPSPTVRPPRFGRVFGAGAVAVADQAVVSGASFATIVIIARTCSPAEFGGYSLALGLALVLRAVVGDLVSSPYTVYCGRRSGGDLAAYTGSTLVHYLVLTAAGVAVLLATAGLLATGVGPAGAATAVWAAAAAAPFLLLREYARRVDLAHLQVGGVFATDVAVAALQVGGLLLLRHFRVLTVGGAFAVVGAGSAAACAVWFAGRGRAVRVVPGRLAADWRHNWRFARWAVAGLLVGSITPFALPWVVAATHGEVAAGVLAACVTLVNLAGMYIAGVTNVLTPRAARAYADGGPAELCRVLRRAAGVFSVTLGGFCLAVVAAGDLPATLVYGPGYAGCGPVLAVLAVQVWVTSLGITAGNGLWAMDRPRANVAADAGTVVATVVVVLLLLPRFGVLGAAAGALIGSTTGALLRIAALLRLMREVRPGDGGQGTVRG